MFLLLGGRMAGVAVDDLPLYSLLLFAVDDCLNTDADGCGPGSECTARHQGRSASKASDNRTGICLVCIPKYIAYGIQWLSHPSVRDRAR